MAVSTYLLLGSIACTDNSVDIVRLNQNQQQEINLNLSETRNIVITDSTKVSRSVTVKFIDIKEGRCPQENCELCYGGYATVKIFVQSGTTGDTLLLNRVSCITDDSKPGNPLFIAHQLQGLSIGLSNLSPFQKSHPIKTYSVKLLIKAL